MCTGPRFDSGIGIGTKSGLSTCGRFTGSTEMVGKIMERRSDRNGNRILLLGGVRQR